MISIQHLRKEYNRNTPLKNINAEIKKGEVISIIGPSGTGKSTLLRCLTLLETPSLGQVYVDGELVSAENIHMIRRKVGMVFQSFNLFPNLTVIENIMKAPVDILGKSRQEAYDRGMELLSLVGLSARALNYPDELSGGQRQRVAIARTLAMDPEIVLFDEPTSALDPTMVGEVLTVIRNLAKQGLTMIIVTHEMDFAKSVSTRVFYLDQGIIYEEGTPEEIFDNPKKDLTRRFIYQLKTYDETISEDYMDLPAINTRLEIFGRKHVMTPKSISSMQAVFEEIFFQNIVPNIEKNSFVRFVVEFSEKDGHASMRFYYNGNGFNPVTDGDFISIKIVETMSEELNYKESDDSEYSDCVEVRLK